MPSQGQGTPWLYTTFTHSFVMLARFALQCTFFDTSNISAFLYSSIISTNWNPRKSCRLEGRTTIV